LPGRVGPATGGGTQGLGEAKMSELDKVGDDNKAVYDGFLGLTKIAIIAVVIVLIGMAIFLV
jgi:hypothetical protein